MRAVLLFLALLAPFAPRMANALPLLASDVSTKQVFKLDPRTGATQVLLTLPTAIRGLAYDFSSDALYGLGWPDVDGSFQVIAIDLRNQTASPIGEIRGLVNPVAIEFNASDGTFLVTDTQTPFLYRFDPESGATLTGPAIQGFSQIEGLSIDPVSGVVYGVDPVASRVITIDSVTGETRALHPVLPTRNWRGIAFDPADGSIYVVAASGGLWRFDTAGGTLQQLANTPGAIQGIVVIPEPGSGLLLGSGLPGLIAVSAAIRKSAWWS